MTPMINLIKNNVLCDNDKGLYGIKHVSPEQQKNLAAALAGTQRLGEGLTDAEFELEQSIKKSREIIENAKAEAEVIVRNAKDQGYKSGYNDGFEQGYTESSSKLIDEKKPFVDAVRTLSQKISEYYENTKDGQSFIEETFLLAEKIIKIELLKDGNAYLGLFRKAAQHISNAGEVTVKTSKSGEQRILADRKKYEDAIDGLSELKIEADGGDEGKCVLETPLGNIDASIRTQLERAKKIVAPQK